MNFVVLVLSGVTTALIVYLLGVSEGGSIVTFAALSSGAMLGFTLIK